MNVGDSRSAHLPGGSLLVARIIEDEYQVDFIRQYWQQGDGYLDWLPDPRVKDVVIDTFSIITCPGDDIRILLMQMAWEVFGLQLGYYQVEGLCDP